MAKRFTETGKYTQDAWFGKLEPKFKALYLFMLDTCDIDGVWEENLGLFKYFWGHDLTIDEVMQGLGEKVSKIGKETFLIKSFIKFQYGKLNPKVSAHRGVIDKALKHGLFDLNLKEFHKGLIESEEPLPNTSTSVKDKDTDTDKDTDKNQNKDTDKPSKPGELAYCPIIPAERIIELFNSTCAGNGRIRRFDSFFLPPNAASDLLNRQGDPKFRNEKSWIEFFEEVLKSDYLIGKSDRSFVVSLMWLLTPDNFEKVRAGSYEGRQDKKVSAADKVKLHQEADSVIQTIIRNGRYQVKESMEEIEGFALDLLDEIGGVPAIFNCPSDYALDQLKQRYRVIYAEKKEGTK